MRRIALILAFTSFAAGRAWSQDTSAARAGLPRDVAREAAELYNAPAALRITAPGEIADDRVIEGDVTALETTLTIAGRVRGRVLAINSNVTLLASARIDGDLLVVGGAVEGRHNAYIGGESRIYREPLRYTRDGDRLVPEYGSTVDEGAWWRRWGMDRPRHSGSTLQIASAGAYNRVEGLPIDLGPRLFQQFPRGSVKLDAYAVLRTERTFNSHQEDVGHNVTLEVRLGRRGGPLLGGRLYDVIDPTQPWQLADMEAGLAAFVMRRDYRDYFARHGAQARLGFFLHRGSDLTIGYAHERWTSRPATDAWTIFRSDNPWRANPQMHEGTVHLVNTTLQIDTRNDSWSPWSGWYVQADVEHGFGHFTSVAPCPSLFCPSAPSLYYARGFLDMRRYNRLSPNSQMNFRLVTGGRLNGDPLPLERRFAVDGPGALPGYAFRDEPGDNVATCGNGGDGLPGLCERMMLVQAEYRGDLHLDLLSDWDDSRYTRTGADGVWVLFLDSGRGWELNSTSSTMPTFEMNELPALSTFRSDVGVGLDFNLFGVYVAKGLNGGGKPVNVFLRIRHRF
jgi:hypothetical protein